MDREWNREDNGPAPTRLFTCDTPEYRAQQAEYRRAAEERAARRRYVDVPELPATRITELFPYHAENPLREGQSIRFWAHLPKRRLWMCHNCGASGWKNGETNETFKCWCCGERNIALFTAGDMSVLLRDNNIGINMEDVYRDRQERQLRERRERTESRRASRRDQRSSQSSS